MPDMVELHIRSHVMSTFHVRNLERNLSAYKVWSVVIALWLAGHICLLIYDSSTYAVLAVILYYITFIVILISGLQTKRELEAELKRIEQREKTRALWEDLYG